MYWWFSCYDKSEYFLWKRCINGNRQGFIVLSKDTWLRWTTTASSRHQVILLTAVNITEVKTWWFVTLSNCRGTWHWQSAELHLKSGGGRWSWGLMFTLRAPPLLPINYITIWLHHLPLGFRRHPSISSWWALCSRLPSTKSELWDYCGKENTSPSAAICLSLSTPITVPLSFTASLTLLVIIQHNCKESSASTALPALWLPGPGGAGKILDLRQSKMKYNI